MYDEDEDDIPQCPHCGQDMLPSEERNSVDDFLHDQQKRQHGVSDD